MAHGVPESLHGLTRERTARGVSDRHRENDRPAHPAFFKDLLAGEDCGLQIQRVKDRLQQEEIDSTVE